MESFLKLGNLKTIDELKERFFPNLFIDSINKSVLVLHIVQFELFERLSSE